MDDTLGLPVPTRARWQPLRLGLIELYHYDSEEFRFHDGHLLLRGNNGTGKSKVLSLTLPFLLDGNLSPSRVEPDGDRAKRMEWNLLMGGRYERRIGYTWIEFGRCDASGERQILTLGCGLRAVAGRAHIDSWFFVTGQRVGDDLWLTTAERTAVSRERLIEAIGVRGRVYDTAQSYRRAVDEHLFRLGADRYAALIDTLIQLRQPQLSKQPNEQRLSDALSEALPPLDRATLQDVADAMIQLEDQRRELEELESMRRSVAAFLDRYRRYARVAARRRARVLRQAQTEHDQASRELHAAEEELARARNLLGRLQADQHRLDEELAADEKRLEVLRADPAMRDAARIELARQETVRSRQQAEEADTRLRTAQRSLEQECATSRRRQVEAGETRGRLESTANEANSLATRCGIAAAVAEALGGWAWPDGLLEAPADLDRRAHATLRDAGARRREQVSVVRGHLAELAGAQNARDRLRGVRTTLAEAFDAAEQALREASSALRRTGEGLLAAWQRHLGGLQAIELPAAEERLADLETWLTSLTGENPLRVALEQARAVQDAALADRDAEHTRERGDFVEEQQALLEERERLLAGVDRPPPVPYTRAIPGRDARPGAPLWQLIDFAPTVASQDRAGLEAALEAAGLLDAWVMPDGELLDPLTHDVWLRPRAACAHPLGEWLRPTVPDVGAASAVAVDTVAAVLACIACAPEDPGNVEAWVAPHGAFRVGAKQGAWAKPAAEYIGHAAREAARAQRLAALGARLAAIEAALATIDTARLDLAQRRQWLREDCERAPAEAMLVRAHSDVAAAERQRREAQVRLGEADNRFVAAERECARIRDTLERDARDLKLPVDGGGLDSLAQALDELRVVASELSGALRDHRRALLELAAQQQRERQARELLANAQQDVQAQTQRRREAEEVLATLQATVGRRVEELLEHIAAAEYTRSEHDTAIRRVRAQLIVVGGQRAAAEQKRLDLEIRMQERIELRQRSVEGLQAFAGTGLLGIAAPELDVPSTPTWGIDAALTVARRAEQSLSAVAADDADWERVQNELGRDLNELQRAMSAQGHNATAEPSDYGLIVRIVYQQGAEQPDRLQQRLDAELAERRMILSKREREVLENHLEQEIAANLQRLIQDTERRVALINDELGKRPTSTGVRYRLDWQVVPEEGVAGGVGLAEARRRLLRTSADAWSSDDRRLLGEFLERRITVERETDDEAILLESLSRALDYRRWHRFRVQRYQDGAWKPLAGPASSGERALGLTVPLFAAASSHYSSADGNAPRLVLLDEAFAGIDDEARASCMGLIREFDLDFVMTSEREWGCYPELPGLAICQLVRREGIDAVFVSRWSWDGRLRRAEADPARRFPQSVTRDA